MSEQWPVKPLGEIATVFGGSPAPQGEHLFEEGIYPFIRTADVGQIKFGEIFETKDYLNEMGIEKLRHFKKGTILIPKSGASTFLNHRVIMGIDAYVASHLAGIMPDKAVINSKFLLYALSRIKAQDLLQENAYPSLNLSLIKEIEIPVPPLEEQERIVKILDEAFEQISNSLNHNEFNLKSASSILSRGIDQEFLNKDTWIEQQFGDVCNFVRGPFGGSLKKAFFVDNGYAVYEQSHAIYDQFETVRYFIDDAKFSEMQRFELKSGDLIMSCSGTIGKIAIVPDGIKPGIINQALLKLTPNELILPEFLKYWMKSMDFQAAIKLHSGGAAIQNVASVKILKQITIHLPSLETQKEIIEKLNLLTHASQDLEDSFHEKKEAIIELKRSILQEAFKGELVGGIAA